MCTCGTLFRRLRNDDHRRVIIVIIIVALYYYHHRIVIIIIIIIKAVSLSRRHRRDVCACMCDGDRRRAAALPRRNTDAEISPSALQNARRAGGNPTGRCVAVAETCDIRLPGGDTEVLGRIERERGVRARRQWPFAGVGTGIRRATSTLIKNRRLNEQTDSNT